MTATAKIPVAMTVDDFMEWDPPDGRMWQLVDGVPVAMAPARRTHGAIQNEIGRLIGNHLAEKGSPCSVVITPGVVPRVRARFNVRIPDVVVTCTSPLEEDSLVGAPTVVFEILSPSNARETWSNVWTYTSLPSVREIVIFRSASIGAEILRRRPDGSWPEEPDLVTTGDLAIESLSFRAPIAAFYRTTRLAAS